jgi:hypothetical protein
MGSLTERQRLWNMLRGAADEAGRNAITHRHVYEATGDESERDDAQFETGRQAAFVSALGMLSALDPDADCGPAVPGRVYAPGGEIAEISTPEGERIYSTEFPEGRC